MGRIGALFTGKSKVDDSVLDELEDVLLTADVGVRLVMELVDDLRDQVSKKSLTSADDIRAALKARLGAALNRADTRGDPLSLNGSSPKVVLFVGVNGVGKTTSIGKVANRIKNQGRTVVLAAGDTFRAAAVEQLRIWGERADCRVISGEDRADPASVIFNAVQHAVETKVDYLLADTAGRLHTKSELMDEIIKVGRAAGKALEGAPHEIWLVVDGTTGQNAVAQAREFNQALGLTGVILTKLDGTAKGGVVIAIANELKLPVRFVGVGEQADDLRPFKPDVFLDALFEPC
jgi:fused signal recognition particle receptor